VVRVQGTNLLTASSNAEWLLCSAKRRLQFSHVTEAERDEIRRTVFFIFDRIGKHPLLAAMTMGFFE
jgi:hypothetical protein